MEKKNTCIIITSEYPYKTAEPFIEDEIKILANAFDRVLVFAISGGKGANATRPIPDNVQSFCIESCGKIESLLKGMITYNNQFKHDDLNFKHVGVDCYFKGKANIAYKAIVSKLKSFSFCKEESITIYSYWFVTHAMIAVLLKQYFEKQDIKTRAISRAHGYDLYEERNSAKHLPYRKSLLNHIDGVFPCSTNGINHLISKYPDMRDKIRLARLGTVDHGISNKKTSNCFVIATCCALIPLKRMKLFIEAFYEVVKMVTDVKWICIGDGPEYQDIYDYAKSKKIQDKIIFTRRLSHDEVLGIYKNNYVDLFCNVSIYEGVPVSIMEAQSFGIPVLATDVGGSAEIVNSDNGWLVDKNISSSELARQIIECINCSDLFMKRKRAREDWENHSSALVNYNEWARIIGE